MTVGASAAQANAFVDGLGYYIQIHTADPGAAGSTGISVGDATRKLATMTGASGGSNSLSSMASDWTNGGTSETLTHISGHTAASAGNFDWSAALTASKAWASADTFALTSLSVSLAPVAA